MPFIINRKECRIHGPLYFWICLYGRNLSALGSLNFVSERSDLCTVDLRNKELMRVEQAIELGDG